MVILVSSSLKAAHCCSPLPSSEDSIFFNTFDSPKQAILSSPNLAFILSMAV